MTKHAALLVVRVAVLALMLLALSTGLGLIGLDAQVTTNPRITGAGPQGGGASVPVGTGTATATSLGVLHTSTTITCTTAVTTEETLWTYTLPANTLTVNGRGVRITAWGINAGNANLKGWKLYFGATVLQQRSPTADLGSGILFDAMVLRTGAAAQSAWGTVTIATTGLRLVSAAPSTLETLSGAIVIKVTGQNGTASASDLCFRGAVVEAL